MAKVVEFDRADKIPDDLAFRIPGFHPGWPGSNHRQGAAVCHTAGAEQAPNRHLIPGPSDRKSDSFSIELSKLVL